MAAKKIYEPLKDLNGIKVKASDICFNFLFKEFEKGLTGTLRNQEWTFWADVTCKSKKGARYTFISNTYGHEIVVDYDDGIVSVSR